ncbi:MAG: ribonuclease H-like domain-containing protein [Planctomycetaceae bacterium]|nr:ribonuclease H-like domain-containing protein [Planctomycetaceae bacterium]
MLDDALRQRLEQLNRRPLPELPSAAPLSTRSIVEPVAASASTPIPRPHLPVLPVGEDVSLTTVVPGEVVSTSPGKFYAIRKPLAELGPRLSPEALATIAAEHADQPSVTSPADAEAFAAAFPRRVMLLDIETCGFAGSTIFLVGLIHAHGGEWILEQLLARDYAEEPAMLQAVWDRATESDVLLTFNGKSFDWPMIHDRSTVHRRGLADRPTPRHLDVLHMARRRWRDVLPNCKLQTLERYICARRRSADLPSAQVPQEYHHFVRTGDARRMADILLHNALDLVTLFELTLRLMKTT